MKGRWCRWRAGRTKKPDRSCWGGEHGVVGGDGCVEGVDGHEEDEDVEDDEANVRAKLRQGCLISART